jgi:hypothetical protein
MIMKSVKGMLEIAFDERKANLVFLNVDPLALYSEPIQKASTQMNSNRFGKEGL